MERVDNLPFVRMKSEQNTVEILEGWGGETEETLGKYFVGSYCRTV
jgi:hypothetical protein